MSVKTTVWKLKSILTISSNFSDKYPELCESHVIKVDLVATGVTQIVFLQGQLALVSATLNRGSPCSDGYGVEWVSLDTSFCGDFSQKINNFNLFSFRMMIFHSLLIIMCNF